MGIWDEEPKLEITEARAIINGIEVKDGDIIVLMKNSKEIDRGTIKFCVYSDAEGFTTSTISALLWSGMIRINSCRELL